MNISYEEIGHLSVTFPAGECTVGQVCKMGADGAVAACDAGDKFCGVVESLHGGKAGVQIHGFATVRFSGAAPATGYTALTADGSGGVKTGDGKEYLVVKVDDTAKTAVIEL